jgi:hypothetical protein
MVAPWAASHDLDSSTTDIVPVNAARGVLMMPAFRNFQHGSSVIAWERSERR